MIATIFALGITVAQLLFVTAKLPSYIHVCNRKDLNYDQCIINSIDNFKDKICAGFPEFNIPQNEPFLFDKIIIFNATNIKLYLRDVKLYGVCDFTINSLHTDTERLHFNFNVEYSHIFINTTYDFDIHLLVPFSNKGPIEITTDNLRTNLHMDFKVVTKHDKKYIFASNIKVNVINNPIKYKFNEDKKELAQLHKILNDVVTHNEKEIFKTVKLVLEEKFSRFYKSLFDKIAFSNYEELFPEEP